MYDNASGDDTAAIVAALAQRDSRVHYFQQPRNIGYVDNIIHGMRNVTTPYFSVLSDDDVLMPDFYETAMAGFNRYPDAMFSAMDVAKISSSLEILAGPVWSEKNLCKFYEQGKAFEDVANGSIPVPWVGTVFRREILNDIGAPNRNAGPHINDNFILHAAARYACVISGGIGCLVTEGSQSVGAHMQALNAEWPQWLNTVLDDIVSDPHVNECNRRLAKKLVMPNFRLVAFQHVIQGLGRFGHRDTGYAKQASIGIGRCGYPVTSVLLRVMIWLHLNFPPCRAIFDGFFQYRKKRTAELRLQLAQRHAFLVEYLQSLEKLIPETMQKQSQQSAGL